MARQPHVAPSSIYSRRIGIILLALLLIAAVSNGASKGLALDLGSLEPQELKEQLGTWTLLDARPGKDWESGHIPGALLFSWEDHIQGNGSEGAYRLPEPEKLALELGRMGISESSPVVVYGDADRSWGGEGWAVWVLSWLGHKGPVRLLDGGIQSWRQRGYPLASGAIREQPAGRHYTTDVRGELNIEAVQLGDRAGHLAVIDTRSTFEWLTGRLPNAVHIPWTEFFEGKERIQEEFFHT
ncbi:MAG: sulfurtransferase, partial [Syntrophobacteraceae bacterium]|nr:sulfurtransferase [Syntrophobacteraceae bacterium]